MSRQAPTGDEYISLKEALELFTERRRSTTERTLQRYCEKQRLDAKKHFTAEGEKWFVTRSSVNRCIDELDNFERLRLSRHVATGRDMSGVVAEGNKEFTAYPVDSARYNILWVVGACCVTLSAAIGMLMGWEPRWP